MEKVKVGEVAEALTGFPFDSKLFNESDGFPLIRIRNLKEGKTDTLYNGKFDKFFVVKKGDLLIGMDGEFNLVEWKWEDALLNQRIMKLVAKEKLASKKYLKYALPNILKRIEDATPFVTVKHLSHKKVLDSSISLPNLQTQQKIASILEQADEARQKRKQANQLTEQFLQSAFIEMFGDPVRNEKKWEVIAIKESGNVLTGTTPPSKNAGMFGGKIPFITPGDLESEEPNKRFVTKEGLENSRTVREGAVFVCCIGATIGKVGRAKKLSAFNQQINSIEWNKNYNDLFGEMLMRFMKPIIVAKGGNSTTLPILNKGNFEKLTIIKPPLSLQQKFASLVERVENLRAKQRASETALENLFQSLMQKYFE
ncbi:MAG: restriction endonuclease subunit S [Ignavibacteriales bacterium]|nr:restriction endonuclease subunit S [Ignavibacteriales bacterium]